VVSEDAARREIDQLLAEQQRYYRERAPRYLEGALSEVTAQRVQRELGEALDAYFRGDVLELACGPGTWTAMLAERATSVTAVDGAPEMLALAAGATRAYGSVRFVEADIFAWRPERRYDAVFFGFWLSHVPEERFGSFWAQVAECLSPGGRVLFVDDAYRTTDELIYGPQSSIVERVLDDGSRNRVVKMPHTAAGLEQRLTDLGWSIRMRELEPFFWDVGGRAQDRGAPGGRAQGSPS
jgi:SAM-dependent methyltransferase